MDKEPGNETDYRPNQDLCIGDVVTVIWILEVGGLSKSWSSNTHLNQI